MMMISDLLELSLRKFIQIFKLARSFESGCSGGLHGDIKLGIVDVAVKF